MKFDAVIIDPPVPFKTWSKKSNVTSRTAASKYNLMDWEELAGLRDPLHAVLAENACVFLWVCGPLVPETMQLAQAWELQYTTIAFTWVKTTRDNGLHTGMGYWTRANAEMVWMFTRGKPKRVDKGVLQALHTQVNYPAESVAVATQVGRHSVKPDEVQHRIERLLGPDKRYLELFARRRLDNWTTVGFELDGMDIKDSLALVAEDKPLPVANYGSDLFTLQPEAEESDAT